MKTDDEIFLSSRDAGFIVRHPLIIACCFLIIFNIFQAYAASIKPVYYSSAAISFEAQGDASQRMMLIKEKKGAAEIFLSSFSIDNVLDQIMADSASEKNQPHDARGASRPTPASGPSLSKSENRLVRGTRFGKDFIRDTVSHMEFVWETNKSNELLTINLDSTNPKIAYEAVVKAVEMITSDSEQRVATGIKANIAFINEQLNVYSDKMTEISDEMDTIKDELIRRYPELSGDEKELIASSSDDIGSVTKRALKKFGIYDDSGEMLNDDLLELQRKREKMRQSLESGRFMVQSVPGETGKEDSFLSEYSKAIAEKEIEIAILLARGYKNEHPAILGLQDEIRQFKNMRKKRLNQLSGGFIGPDENNSAKIEIETAIQEMDLQIAFIRDRIRASSENRRYKTELAQSQSLESTYVKDRVSRLVSLKSEKDIVEGYYLDMKIKLEDEKLKYRGSKDTTGINVWVFKKPVLPTKPDNSRKISLIFKGFWIALLCALALAYGVDRFKDPVCFDKDLTGMLNIQVIGTIGRMLTQKDIARRHIVLGYAGISTLTAIVLSRIIVLMFFGAP